MNEVITMTKERLKALMLETVFDMCADDAQDAAAYVYAYNRLMQRIEEDLDDV